MTKRKTNIPSAGRYRRWGAALMLATLMLATFAGSIPTLHAQSVLRFVEPGSEAPSVAAPLPAPVITAVPTEQASSSEFRFLELKESKTPPLPQFSITAPRESSHEASTSEVLLRPRPTRPPRPTRNKRRGVSYGF